jgi:hypothetical protein
LNLNYSWDFDFYISNALSFIVFSNFCDKCFQNVVIGKDGKELIPY